jgi:hypothetical protein
MCSGPVGLGANRTRVLLICVEVSSFPACRQAGRFEFRPAEPCSWFNFLPKENSRTAAAFHLRKTLAYNEMDVDFSVFPNIWADKIT